MHKLMEFICSEMEELERKAGKDGKLSMAEIQYLDTLAHTKKNLLKADEMWEDSEYSERGGSYARDRGNRYSREGRYSRERYAREGSYEDGGPNSMEQGGGSYERDASSYARGRGRNARRDSMGRYSRAEDTQMMVEELRELMENAPDNQTKMEFQRFIQKIESM